MDVELIKALASVPVELVLIYIIVQQQKQITLLVERVCELQNNFRNSSGGSHQRSGGADDNLD